MKLAVYKIKECISRADWPGAVAALADHYGLQLPAEYRLDVMRDPLFISEVQIFHNEKFYMWSARYGLCCHSRSGPDIPAIAADIYLSTI